MPAKKPTTSTAAKNSPRNIALEIAKALQDIFKKHTRFTRERAWDVITNKEGQAEVKKLIINPARPISRFRTLSFKEWLNNE